MGNSCTKSDMKYVSEKLGTETQQMLISMLYNDLAKRSQDNLLTRDNFEHFFHLSGLWGESVYTYFDSKNEGTVSLERFSSMIMLLAKGDPELKAQLLFQFYDLHEDNVVSYEELVKMFYSYPKQNLEQLFNDKAFHDSLTVRHQIELLRTSTKEDQDEQEQIVEYEDQEEPEPIVHVKKQSFCAESPNELEVPSPTESVKSADFSSYTGPGTSHLTYKINVMIKKYAEFIFKEFNLDKSQSLSLQQFKELLKKHPRLYSSYVEGFHNYLWECDKEGRPLMLDIEPWIKGELKQIQQQSKKKCYVVFIKQALVVFKSSLNQIPIQIIFLPGLTVSTYKDDKNVGFSLKHHDGFYPQRHFIVNNSEQLKLWKHHLQGYFNTSVHEKYIIKEEIGAGAHSTVVRCIKRDNGKEYALKIINKDKLLEVERELVRSEVDIMAKCNHPNIVKLKETFETKTHLFIVTEKVDDGDLFDYVLDHKYCSEAEAALVAQDVLETVKFLNQQGLVHRDLKAQNLMIVLDQVKKKIVKCKIIDFGFATYIDMLEGKSPGEVYVGTANYTAPEILNLKGHYDEKVDMFSVGVIVYLMLSGDLPFNSVHQQTIFENTKRGKYSMKGGRWKVISQQAKNFVRRLLATNATDRMSVTEALQHEWLIKFHEEEEFPEMKPNRGDSKRSQSLKI